MFDLRPTAIPGCFEIQPRVFEDARGRFVKPYQRDAFARHGLQTAFAEEFYSRSRKGVVRGLHFQTPPEDHVKLVYCVQGRVFDAVVDLRVGSPAYGKACTFELDAERGNCLYIPRGLAHGFCALTDDATMVYMVSTAHAPQHDSGILWNSAGIDWPVAEPLLSERDAGFVPLSRFASPFRHEE